jgi:hypothetical protein
MIIIVDSIVNIIRGWGGGGLFTHSMNMRIFTLILRKIFIRVPKIMKKVAKVDEANVDTSSFVELSVRSRKLTEFALSTLLPRLEIANYLAQLITCLISRPRRRKWV